MVTVKVCWKSTGKPACSCKVALGFSDGLTKGKYTNADGEAHFDVGSGYGVVYVDGRTKYEGRLAGRVVVYI